MKSKKAAPIAKPKKELRDLDAKKNPKGGNGIFVPPRGPSPPGG